jgi:DNA-binding HxlR family transcriptional regulator
MDFNVDKILHQQYRAEIIRILLHKERMSFQALKEILGLTDGNLSTHLHTLDEAKYVSLEKKYDANKPKTIIVLTSKGRESFDKYIETIKNFIQSYEDLKYKQTKANSSKNKIKEKKC